jgi:hypothetical protein
MPCNIHPFKYHHQQQQQCALAHSLGSQGLFVSLHYCKIFKHPKPISKFVCQLQVAKVGTSSSALHLIFLLRPKKQFASTCLICHIWQPSFPCMCDIHPFCLSFCLSFSLYTYIYIYRNTHNPMNVSKMKDLHDFRAHYFVSFSSLSPM